MWPFKFKKETEFTPGTQVKITTNPHKGQEGVVLAPKYVTGYIPHGAVPVWYNNHTRAWFWESELKPVKP